MSERVQLQAASRVRELDYDPCPADVPGIRATARSLRDRAAALRSASATAAGWWPSAWQDEAARATAGHLGDLAGRCLDLQASLERAADALDDWALAVGCLQQEAAVLDARAAAARRQQEQQVLVAAPVVRPDALDHELRQIRDRTGELHQRYVAASRRHAARLDSAAPPAGRTLRWWRGATDRAGEGWRAGVRRGARAHEWLAVGTGHGSVGFGVLGATVPATAPVAVPLGVVLAGASTQQRLVLAAGAGGSPRAVGTALLSTVTGVAGGLGWLARLGRASEDAATSTGVALEVGGWDGRSGETWTARVTTDGGQELDVEVHDMAEPWHTGHGLRGHGFAGVATLTVPRSRVGSPAPVSGQRDDEDRVRRRRL